MEYLPFQTIAFDDTQYKLFGIVTHMDWEGEALIHWYHKRCGKSEEAHAVMKEDLAGGNLPSGKFGDNAESIVMRSPLLVSPANTLFCRLFTPHKSACLQ